MSPLVFLAFLGFVIAILVVVIIQGKTASDNLEERLNELAALGQPITLENIELSQPFYDRAIVPILEKFSELAQRFTSQNAMEATQHKLELAGVAHKFKPAQFSGLRMAAGIGVGILAFILMLVVSMQTSQRLMVVMFGVLIGYMGPSLWLGSKIKARQEEIIKSLPDALDLLTICVEAGLGFDAAMSKVGAKWENELSRSFMRTVQEMQLGKLRREALRNMANSMDVPDMTSFVAAIIQADQLGVSMAKVMRIQSDTMRMKRRQRAEEKAHQAPIKMMFPLVFLIFPTILIVLLGPAVIQIKDVGVFGF